MTSTCTQATQVTSLERTSQQHTTHHAHYTHRRLSHKMEGAQPTPKVDIEVARQNVDKLGIRYDELPRQHFWAYAWRSDQSFKALIAQQVMAGSAVTGRQLTQPEKDAIAEHWATMLVTRDWDAPIVVASTSAFFFRTYANCEFPFWMKPANPNKFPGFPESPEARRLWHSLRLIGWYASCKVVISIAVSTYAYSVCMTRYRTDPRLVAFRRAVLNRSEQKHGRWVGPTAQQRQPPARHPRPALPARREPTDAWPGTQSADQTTQSSWSATPSSQPETAEQDPFKFDEPAEFDDASPVAPAERGAPRRQPATQGGSAWDRLRRQQSSNAAGQGSTEQVSAWRRKREEEVTPRGAREGSSFSYTSADEEKVYAKDQAQKDFDEMLERERRGEASGRR